MTQAQKLNWELANEVVAKLTKGSKIVANESKTGISYFQGKKRLVKVLKAKRNIKIEINVKLPKALESLVGMENITIAQAHKKHLGTMKHMFTAVDIKEATEVITAAVETFNKEIANQEKAETKEV